MFSSEPSMRLITDLISHCAEHHPFGIQLASRDTTREAGATAVEEVHSHFQMRWLMLMLRFLLVWMSMNLRLDCHSSLVATMISLKRHLNSVRLENFGTI